MLQIKSKLIRRSGILIIMFITAITPLFTNAGSAHAAGFPYFTLENVNSNLCLDVMYWGANSAPVQQWGCNRSAAQQWYLSDGRSFVDPVHGHTDTWFMIKSRASGRCLTVDGASRSNEGRIIVVDCYGDYYQRWAVSYRYGTMWLRVLHTGKCLEVYGLSRDYGAKVVQWDCWSPVPGPNQKWYQQYVN